MLDLHGVLALLDDPHVTEIVLASGQPVTVRRHGTYRQADPSPLSVDDILDLAADSPLASMLEHGDHEGTVQIRGRHVRTEIHRFGERVMVRLLRSSSRSKSVSRAPRPAAAARHSQPLARIPLAPAPRRRTAIPPPISAPTPARQARQEGVRRVAHDRTRTRDTTAGSRKLRAPGRGRRSGPTR